MEPKPKLVLAVAASEAPVPPSVTARSVMPVMEPPVMLTAVEFCPAMEPRPVTLVEAMEIAVLVAPISLPWASTVKVPTEETEP